MILKCIGEDCLEFKPTPPYRSNTTKRWLCPACKKIALQRKEEIERRARRMSYLISNKNPG